MIKKTAFLVTLLSLLMLTGIALADNALATTFSYQGYLTNANGPVSGTCDFTFALFDAATSGAPVGSTLARNAVAVSNGVFNVQLDFGAGAFDGSDRYLQIAVVCPSGGGALTPLTPRQPLTPTPYTINALNAANAQNALSAASVPWSGITGIPAPIASGVWSVAGNSGTTPATQFIGTTDNQPLELRVNNLRVMRYEPNITSANVIGGYSANTVTAGKVGATIGGGGSSGAGNQVTNDYGTIGGGLSNVAANWATVSGGQGNQARGNYAVIGGGSGNSAGGLGSTVGGGTGNTISVPYATISGGTGNATGTQSGTGWYPAIGGGSGNKASGSYTVIGGGQNNVASSDYATIPGGYNNIASGVYSFAAGSGAQAIHGGAFVWSDNSSTSPFASTAVNQFSARATGGARFVTAVNAAGTPTAGVQVAAGGGSWSSLSDRNAKTDFSPVDTRAVLDKLVAMPITIWNYKTQETGIRHIGPMAQDFYASFGVGEDDTHITTVDADGVALAAIQGMYQVVQEKQGEIDSLKSENADLKNQLNDLKTKQDDLDGRLARLEAQAASGNPNAGGGLGLVLFAFGGGALAWWRKQGA
jgi:hypothetical protein